MTSPSESGSDLLRIGTRPRPAVEPRRGRGRGAFSPGVLVLATMLSAVHLLNFINYTVISGYFNPPITRSILLITFALFILARHSRNLRVHFARSWDVYAICFLAIASTAFSSDPSRTLKYALWLLLAVYVGTELSVRIRHPNDFVAAIAIVLLPASFLVAGINITLGPVVETTGRQFGALGSAHVDTALAMDFVCAFLALRAIPARTITAPRWLRWASWVVLAWAAHQIVFGLTRSVWLGVALALGLYVFRNSLTLKSLMATLVLSGILVATIAYFGVDRILPDAVKGRLAVTEQRLESGQIDPRIAGIRKAARDVMANPQGTGYAVANSHNSYMNILLNLGFVGFGLAMVALARSFISVSRAGFAWLLFFAIGCAPLLMHAFFEVQTWPGQANFIPLLLWYAFSRSEFSGRRHPVPGRRPTFHSA